MPAVSNTNALRWFVALKLDTYLQRLKVCLLCLALALLCCMLGLGLWQQVRAARQAGETAAAVRADLDSLHTSAVNLEEMTGHANKIAAAVESALPRIHKGLFYLWKHADQSLGHIDAASSQLEKASKDEVGQQRELVDKSKETLQAASGGARSDQARSAAHR